MTSRFLARAASTTVAALVFAAAPAFGVPQKADAAAKPASAVKDPAPKSATAEAKTPATPGPAAKGAAAAPTPKIAFETYTLANGLRVILHVDRKLPIVHVNQWFHVGSKNEKPGRTGFAHLFEHIMFQGSKNAPGEYFSYAEKAGANLREGGVNGTTNNDRTNYFATVPSGNLEHLLWLESDRLATLGDALTKENLDSQRDVVKNERRQGLENQPYGRAFKLAFEAVYPSGHPYSWPVIGSHEDLTAASLDDVKEFFKTYYTPNNLSLAITGDFDPAEAKRLVAKYFGGIPAGPALDRPKVFRAAVEAEKVVEVADRVPQERVYMVWPAVEYFHADEAALNLAARILGEGLSSRLNKALVYDKPLATEIQAFHDANEIAGEFFVIATARPGASLAEVESIVTAEIARLAKEGPTPAELDRVKTKQEFDFVSALEGIGGFGGKADILNQYATFLGSPGKLEDDVLRYRRLTPADVKGVVARWLDTKERVLVRFRPEISGRSTDAAANALDRGTAPAFGADRPFRAPSVASATLANGLELLVVERHELPKVTVSLATRAGSVYDTPGKEGTAQLVYRTIDKGTKTRKALDIERALGDLGVTLQTQTAREVATLSLESLKRNVDGALDLLADVVRNPTFPESEFDREKKRHLDALSQDEKNANAISGRVRSVLAFGADHPYGRPVRGLPASVAGVTRDDVARFHTANVSPKGSALVFVGDVTLAEAKALAEKAFGGWKTPAPPPVAIGAPRPAARPGTLYAVDRQDAAQTVVSHVLLAPKRTSADTYALGLVDWIWGGGGFGTRLNLNLREDKGYSYGVFSTLAQFREGGIWFAAGGVQTNKTKESVVEFDKELKSLTGDKPIGEAELADAKVRRVRGYSQSFETFGRVAGQVATLWALGLPMDELAREPEEVAKVTVADVARATATWADPKRATLLLVGDLAKIEAGVKELNLGPLVVLDAEGRPVSR